jgi:lipopolysaccharide export system protein LptA
MIARILVFAAAIIAVAASAQVSTETVPTTIESDGAANMVSTDTETTITFDKNVRVVGTNIRLTCDFLQVVVTRKGDKGATIGKIDQFRSLLARGNVRIVQQDREAACGRAEVLPDQDKIELTESPVVVFRSDSTSRMAGERITLYRGRRTVDVIKPVTTLPPLKDLGFDEKKLLDPDKDSAPKQNPPKQP